MLTVGDVVVTMSYPGLFTVVGLDGDTATIENDTAGIVKVHASNVRRVKRDGSLQN
jgi:hypothetical protein